MTVVNREMQRRVLERLAANYPDGAWELHKELGAAEADGEPTREFMATVQYLQEHDLVVSGYVFSEIVGSAGWVNNERSNITARGLDFLADDGGLGAILNLVTVKIDAGQFAELLARRIEQLPNVSAEEKATITGELRKLPAKGAEKVFEKMLDWSIEHAGDALPLLRGILATLST